MKLSHRKAFKLIIDIQSKPISKSKQTRLDDHLKSCEECQDFLTMKLDMKTTLPWKESNNSRQRATQIKNAVRRDTRRYYMFSRLSKTVKTIAFIGIIGIAMSAIILTKDNLEVTPASNTSPIEIKTLIPEEEQQTLEIENDSLETTIGSDSSLREKLLSVQNELAIELKIHTILYENWEFLSFYLNEDNHQFDLSYKRQGDTGKYNEILIISQEEVNPENSIEEILDNKISDTGSKEINIISTTINDSQGYYFSGFVQGNEYFEGNMWEIIWKDKNVLYTLIYHGGREVNPMTLLNIAIGMQPISDDKTWNQLLHQTSTTFGKFPVSIWTAQENINFEIKIPLNLEEYWTYINTSINTEKQAFFSELLRNDMTEGFPNKLYISQEKLEASLGLENLLRRHLWPARDQDMVIPFQKMKVNEYDALFLRGWFLGPGGFSNETNQSMLSWLEGNILFTIRYFGDDVLTNLELQEIAENMESFVQLLAKSDDSLMHSTDDVTILARILRAQPDYDFELKTPTELQVGWEFTSAGDHNQINDIQEFALNFERSVYGSITSFLNISQGKIGAGVDINELIEILYHMPPNMITWQSVEVNGNSAKFLKGWFLPEGGFDTSISRLEIIWIENGIYYSVVYSMGDIISFNNLLIIAESLIPHSQYFEK